MCVVRVQFGAQSRPPSWSPVEWGTLKPHIDCPRPHVVGRVSKLQYTGDDERQIRRAVSLRREDSQLLHREVLEGCTAYLLAGNVITDETVEATKQCSNQLPRRGRRHQQKLVSNAHARDDGRNQSPEVGRPTDVAPPQ